MARRIEVIADDESINIAIGLNFDDPTIEETEQHQRMAEDIGNQRYIDSLLAEQIARTRKQKYKDFAQEVRDRGLSLNIYKNTDSKRELLGRYFPGKFNSEKQDLRHHTIAQIGKVFAKVYNYAQGRKPAE
jgi:hypothetical protein